METNAEFGVLGQSSVITQGYAPELLFPIARADGRAQWQRCQNHLPFVGVDIWNLYELSWLNAVGKPEVGVLEIRFPHDSTHMIESKSLKLYFFSLNHTRFRSRSHVLEVISRDLSAAAGGSVEIVFQAVDTAANFNQLPGQCVDALNVRCSDYRVNPELLRAQSGAGQQTLHSHLLRSSCPVTGQPDWASVLVSVRGCELDAEAWLRYVVSYRNNQEFHEHCVERMFMDIWDRCRPDFLLVRAFYTRRGGLDINPARASEPVAMDSLRLSRQ